MTDNQMGVWITAIIAGALLTLAMTGFISDAYKQTHTVCKPCVCGQIN